MNPKALGNKLNEIWKQLRENSQTQDKALADLAKAITENDKLNRKQAKGIGKEIVDTIAVKFLDTFEKDLKVNGEVSVSNIKDALPETIKTVGDFYPEVQNIKGDVNLNDQQLTVLATKVAQQIGSKFDKAIKLIDIPKSVSVEKIDGVVRIEGKVEVSAPMPANKYIATRLSDGKDFIDLSKLAKEVGRNIVVKGGSSGGGFPDRLSVDNFVQTLTNADAPIDNDNSTNTPLADGETFTGEWKSTRGLAAISVFVVADQPLSTIKIEWSNDGVTKNTDLLAESDFVATEEVTGGFYVYYPDPNNYIIDKYYRVIATNSSGTNQAVLGIYAWVFAHGSQPYTFLDVDGTPNTLSKALLTRAINPAVVISQFTDADDGSIASGSSVTIDPVLNAESNVLDSGWIDTRTYSGKNIINVLGDTSVDVYLMNASTDQGLNIFGNLAPTLTTTANFPSQLAALYADNYFRVVIVNTSGASLTNYSIRTTAAPESTDGITTGIDQPVFGFFPARIGRNVIVKKQPDGDYENEVASGSDVGNTSTTLLPANQIFLGTWFDTTGYVGGQVTVESDQNSITDGVQIQFTETDPPTLLTGTASFNTGTDVVTATAHGLLDDDRVCFTSTGTLPTGITANESYYVITATTNTFQISETESGAAIDLTGTPSGTHTFTEEPLIHRQISFTYDNTGSGRTFGFPVNQGEYYRVKYTNTSAGQNTYVLRAELMSTAGQLPTTSYDSPSSDSKLTVNTRAVLEAKDEDTGVYGNIEQKDGGIKNYISGFGVDVPIGSYPNWGTSQRNVGSANAIQLAATPLADRRGVVVDNYSSAIAIAIGSDSNVTFNTGKRIYAQRDAELNLDENAEIWAIADSTASGANTNNGSAGTTISSTGVVTPDNAFTSDNAYAEFDTTGDIAEYATANHSFSGSDDTIDQVELIVEAVKQSGQFAAISHQETQTNIQAGGTSITTSAALTSDADDFYLAFVRIRDDTEAVTTMSGLGLTWVKIGVIANTGDGVVEAWRGTGTPTGDSTVTANFVTTVSSASIAVSRWSGVNLSDPVRGFHTNTGSGATWSVATTSIAGDRIVAGAGLYGTASNNAPGGDDTEHSDQSISGASTNRMTSTTQSRLVAGTNETTDGTWGASNEWSALAVVLKRSPARDPKITVSYEISGTPGATSQELDITTTEEEQRIDITADQLEWTSTDIDNLTIIIEATDVGLAKANVDHAYWETQDSASANVARVGVTQIGK